MNEMIWFAIGFAITLIVIAVAVSIIQCEAGVKMIIVLTVALVELFSQGVVLAVIILRLHPEVFYISTIDRILGCMLKC